MFLSLISSRNEWEDAFDNDVAMIRSEHPDDYAGMSGIMSSKVLDEYNRLRPTDDNTALVTHPHSDNLGQRQHLG